MGIIFSKLASGRSFVTCQVKNTVAEQKYDKQQRSVGKYQALEGALFIAVLQSV